MLHVVQVAQIILILNVGQPFNRPGYMGMAHMAILFVFSLSLSIRAATVHIAAGDLTVWFSNTDMFTIAVEFDNYA